MNYLYELSQAGFCQRHPNHPPFPHPTQSCHSPQRFLALKESSGQARRSVSDELFEPLGVIRPQGIFLRGTYSVKHSSLKMERIRVDVCVHIRTGVQWLLVAESLCSEMYVPKYYIDFTQQVSGLSDLLKVDPPPPPLTLTHMKIGFFSVPVLEELVGRA